MRNHRIVSPVITSAVVGVLCLGFAGLFSPWADDYTALQPGNQAVGDPFAMIGPPHGGGQFFGSIDTYSLGVRGSVVLELGSRSLNGPGTDLMVYENPFDIVGDPFATFVEALFVEVSSDGSTWARFPTSYGGEVGPFLPGGFFAGVPTNWYRGFAGVHPVWADLNLGIDPFDVVGGGGDPFDFEDLVDDPAVIAGDVLLNDIRYVRLSDVQGGVDVDSNGVTVWDAGHPDFACADVDGIALLNNEFDIAGSAGRPAVELWLQEFSGQDYLFVSLSDTDGLWTIEQSITASGDGISVNFYELLQFFVLVQVDSESATVAAGPIPPDLYPVELKIAVVDPTGKRGGDAINLP